jgi:hypothetical protein
MKNLRNKLIAGGAVVILAAIGTMMNRQAARADGGTTVTIGAPIPLPVEARQSGTWNVGLTGMPNVNVANAITAPVPTLDISKSATHHVTLDCFENDLTSVALCSSQGNIGIPYVVPAGQNLVVTSVDVFCTVGPGGPGPGHFDLFLTPPFMAGAWSVPSDSLTHPFQYPGGIVFPAGFSFSRPNLDFSSAFCISILQGFLTSN